MKIKTKRWKAIEKKLFTREEIARRILASSGTLTSR
jgi:hypothetical protein